MLLNISGRVFPVSVDKVKPYRAKPFLRASNPSSTSQYQVLDQFIASESIFGQLHVGISKALNTCNEEYRNPVVPTDKFVTEILEPSDKRNYSVKLNDAKKLETKGLAELNTWTVVDELSIPSSANSIGARFANLIKNVGTPTQMSKARYVVQGYNYKMKPFFVHNSPTLRQTSSKIIVSCASLLGFRICLLVINQAYLQSKDKLSRDVFIRPKRKDRKFLNIGPAKLLHLSKPLYGMCDSGDYWGATLTKHVRDIAKKSPLKGDPSLYIKQANGATIGMLGSYIDDCLFAGSEGFNHVINLTRNRFESKPVE